MASLLGSFAPRAKRQGTSLRTTACEAWLSFSLRSRQRALLEYLAAFLENVELVHVEVPELVDLPAEPADFDQVHPGGLIQTEMHAEIVLREITSAAAGVFHLHQRLIGILRGDDDAAADARAVGLGSD